MKSMVIAITLICIIPVSIYAQAEPQTIHKYCYIIKPQEWYKEQEKLWKEELRKNPFRVDAWRNYYMAVRYASMGKKPDERMKLLSNIQEETERYIPDSYLVPYIRYKNGEGKREYIETAYKLKPDCADIYWELIQEYDNSGDNELKGAMCNKLYESGTIIPGLFDYSYNILAALEPDSFIFTGGDNDIFPLWILQEVKGMRKDITAVNAHALFVMPALLKIKLAAKGINIDSDKLPRENLPQFVKALITAVRQAKPSITFYFAPTVDEESVSGVIEKLHNTGLVYLYSESGTEGKDALKTNIEDKFVLDYLNGLPENENHISIEILNQFNMNYITGFLNLSKYYLFAGDEVKSKLWKDKALLLAKKGNDDKLIKLIMENEFSKAEK